MSIFLSPGVYTREKDISDIVTTVASASAALVGYSAKGSVDDIILVTNDQQFINEYGEPDPSSGHYFHYTALAFLARGNSLYCLRVANSALYGGINIMHSTSAESNVALATGQSSSAFTVATPLLEDALFQILGADPGTWNNRIGIKVQNVKTGDDEVPTDQYTFEIVVYWQDDDGNWAQVELWKVSRKKKKDGYGKQLYLEDRINGASRYIVVADNTDIADTSLPKAQSTRLDLASGSNGSEITSSQLVSGWDEFTNPDNVDVRMLINGGETATAVQTKIKTVVEDRSDCMAILDMPYAQLNTVTDMVTWRNDTQNFNSSYCALYSPWPKIHDPYNDLLIRVPPSGYVAAQYAYNDYISNPWDAPAGFTRGQLNVLDLVKLSDNKPFTAGERDVLYQDQINPLQMFRGEGNVIWGQKTQQKKLSALSSVNVRRLLIVIEKSMSISLRSFVFDPNNEITRFRVTAMLNEYLDRLSAQGAFQREAGDLGYHVLCSEVNNPAATIDRLELHVDVFIKPIRAAEYIQLQTIITPTGASFEELIDRGIMF